jgi:CBS domain-containing protein
MKCEEIMTKGPVCCMAGETAMAAAEIMKTNDIGSVPVVEDMESKRLMGIVTDRDMALEVVAAGKDPQSVTLGEFMKSGLVTCFTTDSVESAMKKMAEYQIRRLPVTDRDGCIVGIIAQADVATRTETPEATADMVEEISR